MTKKSELAISELNLLYECTSEENVFHKNKIKKIIDILSDEQTESNQSANEKEAEVLVFENLEEINQISEENLKNETIGHSTRLKANTPMPEKELTWDDIWKEFADKYFKQEEQNLDMLTKFKFFVEENYNVPTRKI